MERRYISWCGFIHLGPSHTHAGWGWLVMLFKFHGELYAAVGRCVSRSSKTSTPEGLGASPSKLDAALGY